MFLSTFLAHRGLKCFRFIKQRLEQLSRYPVLGESMSSPDRPGRPGSRQELVVSL